LRLGFEIFNRAQLLLLQFSIRLPKLRIDKTTTTCKIANFSSRAQFYTISRIEAVIEFAYAS